MSQPKGSAAWATNVNYASPGDPWDATPTKVEPPAGKSAEGWEPTEELAAQFQNDWQNRAGALLEHLRLVQPATWLLERDIAPTTPQKFNSIGYDESTGTLVVTGQITAATSTFFSSNGGRTWILPATPPTTIGGVAVASDGAGNWVIVSTTQPTSESGDDGDNWTTRLLPTAGAVGSDVLFDSANSLWIAVGRTTVGGRRIWTSPDRITWTTRFSDAHATAFVKRIATSAAGFSVALGSSGTGQIFTSTDGLTWTQRTIAGATVLNDVTYSEGDAVWVIAASNGMYTSTDGIIWTLPAGQTFTPAGFPVNVKSDGGGLLVGTFTATKDIYASVDRAVTWTRVAGLGVGLPRGPSESLGTPTAAADLAVRLQFHAGRFMVADEGGNFWQTIAMP